jgi:hypothetical protein
MVAAGSSFLVYRLLHVEFGQFIRSILAFIGLVMNTYGFMVGITVRYRFRLLR